MKIEIINGRYTRDAEAVALLTSTEDEQIAAIAQKLVIRQERQKRIARNRLIDGENFRL